jgi:CheY-like chemotaxis protein
MGMTGWEVLRSLKADPELCCIPVVCVSVLAAENRGAVLGAVDLLDKPIVRTVVRGGRFEFLGEFSSTDPGNR